MPVKIGQYAAVTAARIRRDATFLAERDARFAPLLRAAGPEFEVIVRGGGFGSLVHLILGQQVSVDAAAAMYRMLEATLGEVDPQGLLTLDDATMRRCGFTRQKAGYARGLAEGIRDGAVDLGRLDRLPDADAVASLVEIRGIGVWTAECYLLFGLGRRDVFPAGDLALQVGWQEAAGLDSRPGESDLRGIAAGWSPHRTAAAWLIWHDYLRRRGRSTETL